MIFFDIINGFHSKKKTEKILMIYIMYNTYYLKEGNICMSN